MQEITAIQSEYDAAWKAGKDFSELDRKYGTRLPQIERMLAV